jgi:hypothetical protein
MTPTIRERWRAWWRLYRLVDTATDPGKQTTLRYAPLLNALREIAPDIEPWVLLFPYRGPVKVRNRNMRWIYRCHRYGGMKVAEARRRLIAVGLWEA